MIHLSRARRASSVVVLCLLASMPLILVAPPAAAAGIGIAVIGTSGAAETPVSARPAPMALASTGLDITTPIIVGIGVLLVGIALLAWAFLRTGSTEQNRVH